MSSLKKLIENEYIINDKIKQKYLEEVDTLEKKYSNVLNNNDAHFSQNDYIILRTLIEDSYFEYKEENTKKNTLIDYLNQNHLTKRNDNMIEKLRNIIKEDMTKSIGIIEKYIELMKKVLNKLSGLPDEETDSNKLYRLEIESRRLYHPKNKLEKKVKNLKFNIGMYIIFAILIIVCAIFGKKQNSGWLYFLAAVFGIIFIIFGYRAYDSIMSEDAYLDAKKKYDDKNTEYINHKWKMEQQYTNRHKK